MRGAINPEGLTITLFDGRHGTMGEKP